jgi:hypothetical protein
MSAAMASTSSAELLGEITARRGPAERGGQKSRRQKISDRNVIFAGRGVESNYPTNQSFNRLTGLAKRCSDQSR